MGARRARSKKEWSAGVIVIGDELLDGRRDTNGPTVEATLTTWGIDPRARLVLPDALDAVAEGVASFVRQFDVVITCGGLGPTQDDVTRAAVAQAVGRPLEFREDAWRTVQARFKLFKRPCTESNRSQAWVPKGSVLLLNPNGTAPGFFYRSSRALVAALPGPPRELIPMLEKQLGPKLRACLPVNRSKRFRRSFRVCGLGESHLQDLLGPLSQQPGWPELGFLLDEPGEILVILTVRERSAATARTILQQAQRAIREKVGAHWVGDAEATLSAAVGALLLQRGQTLAVAESCTGGWLAHRITSDPGCSAYFKEGVIAYSNETKIKRLRVSRRLLSQKGAVSEPVALAMAEGVRTTSGADWGVATTGIAGPGGGTPSKPVGTVCLACAGPRGARWVQTVQLWGERHLVQRRAATLVLDQLRRCLGDQME